MNAETKLDFTKIGGLIPAVIQDAATKVVLMVGFMNEEAYRQTLEQRRVTFFSRTKNRLWTKGETTGHFLDVVEILIDCDGDTILIKAKPHGPTCHTGADTCFNEENNDWSLAALEAIIKERKANPNEGS